jgi:hypothetical protein
MGIIQGNCEPFVPRLCCHSAIIHHIDKRAFNSLTVLFTPMLPSPMLALFHRLENWRVASFCHSGIGAQLVRVSSSRSGFIELAWFASLRGVLSVVIQSSATACIVYSSWSNMSLSQRRQARPLSPDYSCCMMPGVRQCAW